ncbi:MAG: hypothetical protein WC758_07920 [Candidatus Woesearchaeota archaeon]|jgi:hypothetical protein
MIEINQFSLPRTYKKKIVAKVIIDIEDIDKIKNYKWSLSSDYARTCINKKTVRMHQLLLSAPDGKVVHHINHNTFDNRKKNLKIVFPNENRSNNLPKDFPRIFDMRKDSPHLQVKGEPKTFELSPKV